MSRLPFRLESRSETEPAPEWDGTGFRVGSAVTRVYAYDVGNNSGWNEELTRLHEEESEDGCHFIDIASRRRALSALSRHVAGSSPTLLEVGVSSGHFLRVLREAYPDATIIGADYTIATLNSISDAFPGLPLIQTDLTRPQLPENSFDAIVLLNVLEHIEDDGAAARNCLRMLKPGGHLIVEVPAGPHLYDDYDRQLMHFRRYDGVSLRKFLKDAGFDVKQSSHLGFFLYPLFAFVKKRGKSQVQAENDVVRARIKGTSQFNAVGRAVMQVEEMLSRAVEMPVGIRCTAVAQKPLIAA